VELVTERLTVRAPADGDAAFMHALLNDADFIANIGDRGVRTADAARDYLMKRAPGSMSHPALGFYVVARRSDETAMGICTLLKRDHLDAPDLGFAFLPAFRSQGYAFESSLAFRDFALGALQTSRLLAIALTTNVPSARLLGRLGFSCERTMPDDSGKDLGVYEYHRV
jgi:ribosomal-protein-alanine N-acetyltransferase